MTFRLRHRASFDPLSITHALNLRAPRLKAPDQWHWAWPLHRPTQPDTARSSSSVRHVWVSAIRVVAVSDDASALAFVSHTGTVALAACNHSDTLSITTQITVAPFVHHDVAELCSEASSVVFFDLAPESSVPPRKFLAVGYQSGAIAVFDVVTATLLTLTRPHDAPVRRLRFYTAFHLLPKAEPYPVATANSGLLAAFGWSGTIARIPSTTLLSLLQNPPTIDLGGARWLLWNLSAQDAVLDAVACGSDPSSICEMDDDPSAAALRITAVGVNPPVAAYSVTSDPAFSARAAAKRAASTVFSAAKGFLLSRIGSSEPEPPRAEEPTVPITGVARHSTSWADDPSSVHGVINFGDVRDTARKSVSAVLQRGRRLSENDSGRNGETRQNRFSGSAGGFNFRRALQNDTDLFGSQMRSDGSRVAETLEQHMLTRQRSRFEGEAAKHAEKLPQNTRIVERLSAAPMPCSLLATCDTLGRIFVQDSRDLCVLRILKGYRDAQVAWLAEGGPILVVYAPRLNVLELHVPLEQKRMEAFRLVPGAMVAESASNHVFSVSPDGHLYELARGRKGPSTECSDQEIQNGALHTVEENDSTGERNGDGMTDHLAPDYELIGAFTEAVKSGHMSRAIDCLQGVEHDGYKVAHLMATLVTCTSYTSTEVHVALSSKASQIAAKLRNPNLLSRFDAHRKLAEAFGLLASDALPVEYSGDNTDSSKHGRRLLEDDLGAGLAVFAGSDSFDMKKKSQASGKRSKTSQADTELVNCERFILSHALVPTVDLSADVDFELHARSDLSEEEQIWLSKAYFWKLLDTGSMDIATPGREHPTTVDVFLALTEFIGLSEEEIARHFVQFALNVPILQLLNTHASTHASPLRCAVARLRSRFSQAVVDPILLDGCETTSHIPNAVLLTRLCAVHTSRSNPQDETNPFLEPLDRLGEVLLYRKMISASKVPPQVYKKFTARRCTGVPGDAERHAITCLIAANDFERASKILTGLEMSRKLQNLDWHESASVSEAALHSCRKKAASLLTKDSGKVVPQSVLAWILAAVGDEKGHSESPKAPDRVSSLQQIRTVLLNAQQHIPDSSVDAVRCLQLAEAMSALIGLEKGGQSPVAPTASQDLNDMQIPLIKSNVSKTVAVDGTAKELDGVNNVDRSLEEANDSGSEEFFDAPMESATDPPADGQQRLAEAAVSTQNHEDEKMSTAADLD